MATKQIKIKEPDGIALQLTLEGHAVTLSDLKGQVFEFNAQLIPEVVGALQDLDRAYCSGWADGRD